MPEEAEMNLELKIKSRIKKKNKDIQSLKADQRELEMKLREAQAGLQELEEMIKHIPGSGSGASDTSSVRKGGSIDKAIRALKDAGKPMYIDEILGALGTEVTSKNRKALSAQLNSYRRAGRIFTRDHPNTFGLHEWEGSENEPEAEEDDPLANQ